MKVKTREICLYGILGVIIFILKLIMAPLPNIEPVSLLIIVYTIVFGRKAMYALSTYVCLEVIVYGFGIWSIGYCYIWVCLVLTVLYVYNLRQSINPLMWSIVSGAFGIIMGALYIPLYIISGGYTFALSWWISGVPYDIIHGVANFVICLVLFKPMTKLLTTLKKQYKINE